MTFNTLEIDCGLRSTTKSLETQTLDVYGLLIRFEDQDNQTKTPSNYVFFIFIGPV